MSEEEKAFFRNVSCGGRTLRVKQLCEGDVGCVVWDAALVLCKFLESQHCFPGEYWKGKSVVELGSGTGLVGLAAGVLGANVVLTDLPECVSLMNSNIELNRHCITGSVSAKPLTWGKDDVKGSVTLTPNVILMSDVVYYTEAVEALVKTLVELSNDETTVIMSYEERDMGNKPLIEKTYFELMNKHFTHSEVPLSQQDPQMSSPDIHIIIFKKKRTLCIT